MFRTFEIYEAFRVRTVAQEADLIDGLYVKIKENKRKVLLRLQLFCDGNWR